MPARLEVIAGPMFSGKTEELVRRINRSLFAKRKVLVLKPQTDTRTMAFIRARGVRNGRDFTTARIPALVVDSRDTLVRSLERDKWNLVAADEAQFFGDFLYEELRRYLEANKAGDVRVILSGLDLDFALMPFNFMPQFLAMADEVTKLTAVCMKCGGEARFTQRLTKEREKVVVGGSNKYQARCRECHYIP
jgi:thymidine kinase